MRKCANCGERLGPNDGLDVTDDSEESRYYCDLMCVAEKEPEHPLLAGAPDRARARWALYRERRELQKRFKEAGIPW